MTLRDEFDPYHRWLSIPPGEQPPTLYRLLGLSPFEEDAEVVHAAADRQMVFLKTLCTGDKADVAQRLLNEVSAARVTLTGAGKAAYDAVLRGAAPAARDDADGVATGPEVEIPAKSKGASQSLPVSFAFGPFDIVELYRQSPLGDMYRATHRDSGRTLSLKVLPPKSTRSVEVVRRFEREQRIVTQLRHPNLIAGLGYGVESGQPWLAMEYVVGMDLATLVKQRGGLPVAQAVDFIVQAARGLMQLHMRDICHRNVKPQVLWVDVQGRVKVTNLFLAKLGEQADVGQSQQELTMQGQQMGTVDYLSPEQGLDAKEADARSDVYSLGCTLHYLLVGHPPYVEKSPVKKLMAHQKSPIPSLRAHRADVPEDVDQVFQKMLAKDPAGRFQTMAKMIDALVPQPKRSLWQRLLRRFARQQ